MSPLAGGRLVVCLAVVRAVARLEPAHDLSGAAAPASGPDKMSRKDGQRIAQRLVDLALREIARVVEVGAGEIGAVEPGAQEIGALEQRFAQIRAAQIGAVEPRVAEIGIGQVGHFEIGAGQRGEAQGGVAEPGEGEIDGSAADRPHLPLGRAQRNAGEVRGEGGILRAPLVPRPRAAAQRLDMFGSEDNATHATT